MRGTAAGERVVSQAQTKAFDEGHERIFGKNKRPQRGRFVYDERLKKMVPVEEYVAPVLARNASIMVDRYMEGVRAQDGTDIGSRRKRRDYMKAKGLADLGDFTKTWEKADAERRAMQQGDFDHRQRRDDVGRAMYQRMKP